MKTFSMLDRKNNLQFFKESEFDLLIIGGGITGAGAARDAAARGMKVALIEARDFASGTSSRSSKLIHGGIRYLENIELKLVFEALSERTKLFEMAPHLVHPLRFMIPLYKDSRVGMTKMGLGMWLYDALAFFQAPEMHERLSASESMNKISALRERSLCGSYVYSDAYMDDDRLVLETLRSANALGAKCASYVKATGARFGKDGTVSHVECEDQINHEKFVIKAKHVISSVGPWTDQLGESLFSDWKKVLRPTKGIHLTLPKNRLPLSCAVVMGAEKSDRIVFGIPRNDMIIVGTTDTDFKGSPEDVITTSKDVHYLLDILDQYFPGAKITSHDIIASYAGVRPLVKDDSSTEGKTSREHVIINDPRGVTLVAGGKYTTYRLMAEQVIEASLRSFSIDEKIRFKKTDTAQPLNSEASVSALDEALILADHWASYFQRDLVEVQRLAERYGMEAEKILQRNPSYYTYWQLEANQAIEHTMCSNLIDFYTRRVPLFLADRNHGLAHLDEITTVFASHYSWTKVEAEEQQHHLQKYMAHELNWKKEM